MKTGHNIRACRVAAFSAGLVALGLLYTSLAVRMAQTPVYDRDGLIFQADTAEAVVSMEATTTEVVSGARLAEETARRLALPEREAETLRFLVHKHLLMSHLARLRDINDPDVVLDLAVQVGSPEVLQMLYVLTAADLAAYRTVWRDPVRGHYRGYDVVGMPPPSSGGVHLVQMLNILENITQGVSVVDSSQRLIGWNSRYEQLMSYPPGMVHVGESIIDLIRFNGEQGRFGTADVDAEVAHDAVDWTEPSALIVGGEATGAGLEAADLASGQVSIPMVGGAESLNAAMAASRML